MVLFALAAAAAAAAALFLAAAAESLPTLSETLFLSSTAPLPRSLLFEMSLNTLLDLDQVAFAPAPVELPNIELLELDRERFEAVAVEEAEGEAPWRWVLEVARSRLFSEESEVHRSSLLKLQQKEMRGLKFEFNKNILCSMTCGGKQQEE